MKVILEKASHCSYLKDKGAAYRYSQDYKLQREILTSIGPVLYNVDADSADISSTIHSIRVYLSDRQPQELQVSARFRGFKNLLKTGIIFKAAAADFVKMMAKFDREAVKKEVETLLVNTAPEYQANVDRLRRSLEDTELL